MAIERKWDRIPPRAFVLDGEADGSVYLNTTKNFKVKQKVAISATGMPDLSLEVKRIVSPTQLIVGPVGSKMSDKKDLSNYTLIKSSSIRAEEQDRPGIPTEQHERAVYAEEPILAKRAISVDEFGNYYNSENPSSIRIESINSDAMDPFSAPFGTNKLEIDRSGVDYDIFSYKKDSLLLKKVKVIYSSSAKTDIITVELI